MSALATLTDYGLHVEAQGDKLIVSPASGLNDELRAFIRDHKPDLILELAARVGDALHGIPLADLEHEAGADWSQIQSDPELMDIYARAVMTRRMRERGQVPPEYTAVTRCRHCGPVPIFETCPPEVLGCPWCWNRLRGKPNADTEQRIRIMTFHSSRGRGIKSLGSMA